MAIQIWRRIKLCLLEIWTIILSILALFLLPLLILLLSPLYLYRFCLGLYIKHFRKDFGKILSCGNSTMASYDEIYGNTQNTTVIAIKVEGQVDIEEARALVRERIIEAKNEDGTLKYPELQQYPVKFGGYYVWKPVEDFDVCNHVNFHTLPEQRKIYTDEDAADVESYLGTKQHPSYRGPWEFVILPNVKSGPEDSEHSFIFFRTHHSVTDGFGIFNLLFMELSKGGSDNVTSPIYFKRNIFWRIIFYLTLIIRIPYDLLHIPTITAGKTDSGFRDGKNLSKDNHVGCKPLIISIDYLKEIRKIHNVTFNAVINAAFLGGLRKMMVHNGMRIPASMGLCCPGPMPGHPLTKLRVHASVINTVLPIGIDDSVKRLKSLEKEVQRVKRSTAILGSSLVMPLIGALPPFFIDKCFPGSMTSGCVNNFPGPRVQMTIFNRRCTSVHFIQGQSKLLVGILCTALTYMDQLSFKITVNKAIFKSKSEINLLHNYVLEELEYLRKEQV